MPPVTGWLRGEGATEVTIREHGWKLTLDVHDVRGHEQEPAGRRCGGPFGEGREGIVLAKDLAGQERKDGAQLAPGDGAADAGALVQGHGHRRRRGVWKLRIRRVILQHHRAELHVFRGGMEEPRFWIASARDFDTSKKPEEVGHEFAGVVVETGGVVDAVAPVMPSC